MPKTDLPQKRWDAILPCPFCNAPGELLSSPMHSLPEFGSNACVLCKRCGAAGPLIEPKDYVPIEHMDRQAIRLWNRRGSHQNTEWKLVRIAQILGSDYVERSV
jgi:hypothetical protein